MEVDGTKRFLDLSRFWVQKVFVPIVVCVGVIGNLITVIILTRKRMKCSTNVYLTALALADLVYLLFVLILSFEHYSGSHSMRYLMFWRFYGLTHWIVDAASYISIWLTVSFTVERYIAVCHPIRGKMFCTENRAKRVIFAVCIFCIFTTITTSFEYEIDIRSENATCNATVLYEDPTVNEINFVSNYSLTDDSFIIPVPANCNSTIYFIYPEASTLADNEMYRTIFYWFTCIMYVFVPLVLLATFNCFLINAVHQSQKQRDKMTNSQERSTATQENRITMTLIAVVILFIVCQSPTAGMLIYTTFNQPEHDSREDYVVRALGNLFNFLVNLNAACNFLLYCALSDKYRRTFKAVFFGGRWGSSRRDTNMYTSSFSMSRRYPSNTTEITSTNNPSHYNMAHTNGLKRNISAHTQRSIEKERIKRIARTKSAKSITSDTEVTSLY